MPNPWRFGFIKGNALPPVVKQALAHRPLDLRAIRAAGQIAGGGIAPANPTGLTATAGNAQVALSWTAPTGAPGAASYNVYYSLTSNMASPTLAANVGTTSYTVTGLSNGTLYYFGVVAVASGAGVSGYSNIVSATPSAIRVYDQFIAADNTVINGRTPSPTDYLTNTWATAAGGGSTGGEGNSAAAIILSNTAQATTYAAVSNNNRSFATIGCGASDLTITHDFVLGTRDNEYSYAGPVFRWQDASNFLAVELLASGTVALGSSIVIRKVVGNSFTTLASVGTGTDFTRGTTYHLTVTLSGTSISVSESVTGLTVSTTTSQFQTNQTHGFFVGHTSDNGSGSATRITNWKGQ